MSPKSEISNSSPEAESEVEQLEDSTEEELTGQNEASPSAEKVPETFASGDGEEVLLDDNGEKAEDKALIISEVKIPPLSPAVTGSDSLTTVSPKAVISCYDVGDMMNVAAGNEVEQEASPSAGLGTMSETWNIVTGTTKEKGASGISYGVNKPPRSPLVSAVNRETRHLDKVKKQVKMCDGGDGVDSKDGAMETDGGTGIKNSNRNTDGGTGSKSADAKLVNGGLKSSRSVAAKLSSLATLLDEPELGKNGHHEGGNSPNENGNGNGHGASIRMMKEAWERLYKAYAYYKAKPIGMVALDPCPDALNYNQVFIRDFIPCGLACLMKESKEERDIVKNFLSETLRLQRTSDNKVDNYTLGKGAMPASFSVKSGQTDGNSLLLADFGGTTVGRVAPSDSGFWWIILLRAYTQCTGSQQLSDSADFQTGIKGILNLCLADGFDAFPTLLCADACCMIDRRMGMYGYPIEIQALFFFALRCAKQLLIAEDCKELIYSIDKRITALIFHIQTYYWLDFDRLNKIYRYKTEEHSHTAVNKFNVNPDSIPGWIFDFMPLRGGYFIGNVGPSRNDFRWFAVGNCIAILCSLATPQQANAIMDLIEARWEHLIGEMPLKIAYPAVEKHEWETMTGCDTKNTPWSNHNAGSWPVLLWLLTAASIKTGRPHIAKKAIEQTEQRLAKDGWPEYYDGKRGRFIGKQARKYQTWSIAGYLVAKLLMENPASIRFVSFPEEEDRKIARARPKLTRSQSCPCFTP